MEAGSEDWEPVARFDHQPHLSGGHDVFDDGLHIDIYRSSSGKEQFLLDWPIRDDTDWLLDFCLEIFADEDNREYLLDIYHENIERFKSNVLRDD